MAVKVVMKSQKAAAAGQGPVLSTRPEFRETFMNRFFRIMLMDIRNRFDPHYRKELEKFNDIALGKR